MESRRIQMAFESLLVMLLLIIFAVSSCIMIVEGSKSYENIIHKKEIQEDARTAFSYINMRIKQNDVAGHIKVYPNFYQGKNVLALIHSGEEEGYITYIFWSDDKLYECYTDIGTPPDVELSSVISPIDFFEIQYDENLNAITYSIAYTDQIVDGIVAVHSKQGKE